MERFLNEVKHTISTAEFLRLKISLIVNDEKLKEIIVEKTTIKNVIFNSVVSRFETRDITKNLTDEAFLIYISDLLGKNKITQAILFTTNNDIILRNSKGAFHLKKTNPSLTNKEKKKTKTDETLNLKSEYLRTLGITNNDGVVVKKSMDKYKQIHHYIQLLKPHLQNIFEKEHHLNIADMGSGKGYLTFALYDYLQNHDFPNLHIEGIELRPDLVEKSNHLAAQSGFNNLTFHQNSVAEYHPQNMNVLIALHACDTATDDAIKKGIDLDASLIIVAPCCHKQIRKEMECAKIENEISSITKHGIFLERQATMVTDSIRAEILNYYGYKTKIIEFVNDAHTPKNIMIIAEKTKKPLEHKLKSAQQIKNIKQFFGIKKHYLEMILGITDY